jgi:hypothetical protein
MPVLSRTEALVLFLFYYVQSIFLLCNVLIFTCCYNNIYELKMRLVGSNKKSEQCAMTVSPSRDPALVFVSFDHLVL